MKKLFAVVATVGLAGLTACSVSTPAPDATASTPAPASSSALSQPTPSESSGASADGALGVKEACEKFNSLYVQYRAAGTDSNAHEDVYRAAADAKDNVSGNLKGLFTSMAVLALDQSSEIETGTPVAQASKDAVRDAVFANAGACTAEGVTLTL